MDKVLSTPTSTNATTTNNTNYTSITESIPDNTNGITRPNHCHIYNGHSSTYIHCTIAYTHLVFSSHTHVPRNTWDPLQCVSPELTLTLPQVQFNR